MNDIFIERGFEAVGIIPDAVFGGFPDVEKLISNLNRVFEELDKIGDKLRSKMRDTGIMDRLRQEVERYRQEYEKVQQMNEKLKIELINERKRENEKKKEQKELKI